MEFPGTPYPGSELDWGGVAGPSPSGESHEGMRKIVFTSGWDYHTIKVPEDVERAVKADTGLLYGGDPDISRFFNRGGKLLMYHGWADPLVSPDTSVIMFNRIDSTVGSRAASSLALFMVPVWKDLRAVLPTWDEMVADFNRRTGLLEEVQS